MTRNGADTQPAKVAVLLLMKVVISFLDVWWHGRGGWGNRKFSGFDIF
jgi:hypothetical protein